MKNKFKGLLAVTIALAFVLTTTPLASFAAGQSITVSQGSVTPDDASLTEGDKIDGSSADGAFIVEINGKKDTETARYGEKSFNGYSEKASDAQESGNIYYDSYTVPAAPEGYKDGAAVSAVLAEDYYKANEETVWHQGNIVKLTYSPIKYTLSFDLSGGKLSDGSDSFESVQIEYDSEFTLPTSEKITKEGFVLSGWTAGNESESKTYAPGEKIKNLTTADGAEMTLTAVWSEKAPEFTITYYLSEDEQYGEPQTYKAGDTVTALDAPAAKEGYVFAGWILGKDADGNAKLLPETMPAENLKAYASWKLKDIKVTYMNDGEEYSSTTAPYGSGMENTVPADPAEKEGYTFAGWYDAHGNNVFTYSTVPSADITFTAKWLKNGNVTYMVGDKTYEAFEVKEGDKVPVPEENPEKFAHIFKGWNPEIPETMPAEDLVFTAQFEVDKNFVTVVIGGTVIAGGVITAIVGAGAAAIAGISIIGGLIALIGGGSLISKTYTVTFKVDGKTYETYKLEAGEKIPAPKEPKKEGYNFTGWSPEVPGTMPKKNMTFEAQWSEIDDKIPSTGSAAIGVAAFAALAVSAAAAIIFAKKKKEDK